MALDAILRMFREESVTPDTLPGVSPKPACLLAVTPVTCVTPNEVVTHPNERIAKMIGRLEASPGLIYAMEPHEEVEPDTVLLTLAIRGKGACELRIPKSRYDGMALLELFERHTRRETLQ